MSPQPARSNLPDLRRRESNGGGQQTRTLHRDFVIFDADGNGRMIPQEFLTIPYFTLEDQLAPLSVIVVPSMLKARSSPNHDGVC